MESVMIGDLLASAFGVLFGRWLDRRKDSKRVVASKRKGVHPLLAVGGLMLGALVGTAVGFLYSPKGREYRPPME
jgi:hypothetical protein